MADNQLVDALNGLNLGIEDSPWGIGATTLAAMAPKFINPYGKVGTNLAVGLGTTLITALLGSQAKQDLLEKSLEANKLGAELMRMPTASQRLAAIENLPEETSTTVKRKLLGLSSALEGQRSLINLEAEKTQAVKQAELEALTSPAGEKYVGLQTDKLLQGIGARGEESRSLEALRQAGKLQLQDVKAQNDRLKLQASTEEKAKLDKILAAQRVERINAGEDPDVIETQLTRTENAYYKSLQEQENQKNELQKIQFKSISDAAATKLDPAAKKSIDLNTAVADRAYKLAAKVEKMGYLPLKGGLKFTNLTDENLKSEFEQLLGDILKAKSGTGVSGKEYDRTYASLAGDFTGGADAMVQALRLAGDNANNLSLIHLQNSQKSVPELYNTISGMMANKKGLDMPVVIPSKATLSIPEPAGAVIGKGASDALFELPATAATATPSPNNERDLLLAQAIGKIQDPNIPANKKQQIRDAVAQELGVDLTKLGY